MKSDKLTRKNGIQQEINGLKIHMEAELFTIQQNH